MNSDNPHPLRYARKTKRRADARHRLALATPKDRQCALRAKKSPPIVRQAARESRQIKTKFGNATAARDEFAIVVKQRALLSP
ncbi:hypothetical protein [Sinorhizobium fredii]|uniref:hypothetical protein n=1 Tax=Rhizobium fredii TaxID=380 RepID=UPI0012FD1AB1|nr:hypothetical protein [Sinorhizobium fredii]